KKGTKRSERATDCETISRLMASMVSTSDGSMTEKHSFLSATLGELTRRKVLSSVGAYAVAVFVLLQLMDAAVDPLRLPDWLPTIVVIILILGFPVVFLLAWEFELTSEGIKKARPAGLLTRRQSMAIFASMLLVTFGLGYGF